MYLILSFAPFLFACGLRVLPVRSGLDGWCLLHAQGVPASWDSPVTGLAWPEWSWVVPAWGLVPLLLSPASWRRGDGCWRDWRSSLVSPGAWAQAAVPTHGLEEGTGPLSGPSSVPWALWSAQVLPVMGPDWLVCLMLSPGSLVLSARELWGSGTLGWDPKLHTSHTEPSLPTGGGVTGSPVCPVSVP